MASQDVALPSAVWRGDFLRTLSTKMAMTLPGAVVALAATRLISANFGVTGLGFFTLVTSLTILIPFADFGIGGSITQTVARRHTLGVAEVSHVLKKSILVLSGIATSIIGVSFALEVSGRWSLVLGVSSPTVSLGATLVMTLFALNMVPSLAYRVLLGMQANHVVIAVQSVSGVGGSLLVIGLVVARSPLWLIVVAPQAAGFIAALAAAHLARRRWAAEGVNAAPLSGVSQTKRGGLLATAWPLALIAVAAPIAYQSDRVILGNFGDSHDLAMYAGAFQLYAPANGLIIAVGQTLWPRFAALRASDSPDTSGAVIGAIKLFALIGLVIGLGMCLLTPFITVWSTKGLAPSSWTLSIFFGGVLLLNSLNYPLGMYLMQGKGLVFQALANCAAAAAKVLLAVPLIPLFGAAGPVLATCFCISGLLIVPSGYLVGRSLAIADASRRGEGHVDDGS